MKSNLLIMCVVAAMSVTTHAQQRNQTSQSEQPLRTNPLVQSASRSTADAETTQPTVSDSRTRVGNGVIEIEDTIRVKREQPKVLSIVPWQPPRDKTSLPSPFVQRIEQDFRPLNREEFIRKVAHFERVTGTENK